MSENDLQATADYWDAYVDQHMFDGQNTNRAEWLAHPTVQEHHRVARGNRSVESWVAEVALAGRPRGRGVGIGAGTGSLELGLVVSNTIDQFDLLDVSSGALQLARQNAEAAGVADRITTVPGDVGAFDLGRERYDLATFMGSLHHVSELDAVVGAVANSVVPDGVLVAYEYVGPDRFATGPVEREIAQRLYRALDPSLRSPNAELPLPDPEAVIKADPTEAVHSSEILRVLRRHFDNITIVRHGGALAYTLWWGLAHDALFETKEGWEFVDVLLRFDAALTTSGALDDYFVTIMASAPLGH